MSAEGIGTAVFGLVLPITVLLGIWLISFLVSRRATRYEDVERSPIVDSKPNYPLIGVLVLLFAIAAALVLTKDEDIVICRRDVWPCGDFQLRF